MYSFYYYCFMFFFFYMWNIIHILYKVDTIWPVRKKRSLTVRISGFVIFGWIVCLFSFLQPMGCQILSAPPLAWAAPPVPNLSLHHHLMPTARNTDGKKAQASPNRMAFLQGMKVKGCKNVQVWDVCTKNYHLLYHLYLTFPLVATPRTSVVYWISVNVLAFVGLF